MANSSNGLTKGGNLKRADLNTYDISDNIVVRAFKKCSILNCLSGSEDHLIYDDSEGDEEDSNSEDDNLDEYAVESDNYESDKCESDEGEFDESKSNEREFDEDESDEDGNTSKYN
ncbi:5772_t:CDS:2, partial [Gigaspora rosea]